jgi:WD40 repeat protein
MRGIISCLSLQPRELSSATALLAAGTWTRWIGLYDAGGLGGTVANWSIASAADSTAKICGGGISQTLWSPCGRYLYVVERKSRGILVYDVRVTGRLVGWLEGRAAETNQRLGVDIFSAAQGQIKGADQTEMWAGDVDGVVRVWKWSGFSDEGGEVGLTPEKEWRAHESAVSGVATHPSGTVVATCSGQRQEVNGFGDESDSDSDDSSEEFEALVPNTKKREILPDSSMKIWGI